MLKGLPSKESIQLDWSLWLLSKPEIEQIVLVASQIELLRPIMADPEEWCREAIELARSRRRHG
jgi:putative ubiquitin-RnfH superfamily antitoxin RatB of RatAB toxin-antitoxin module